MILNDTSSDKKSPSTRLWFSKHQFSELTGIYGQTVAANMFKDYSFELCPTGHWQKFHFKRHANAESEIWIQVERQSTGKMYTVYDKSKGVKKRSSKFSRCIEYLYKCLHNRSPALHRHLFDKNSEQPQLRTI